MHLEGTTDLGPIEPVDGTSGGGIRTAAPSQPRVEIDARGGDRVADTVHVGIGCPPGAERGADTGYTVVNGWRQEGFATFGDRSGQRLYALGGRPVGEGEAD